ncbi:uncharacterized protein LOC142231148 [Haematobia irritans]|uniref:uncharacterized protein LOC142231148 n=1 Tax=Haematobia irritans TaxID=7368 RepID=UPI003F4F8715
MADLDGIIQMQRDSLELLRKYEQRFDSKPNSQKTSGFLSSLGQRIDDVFNVFESQHQEILQRVHDEALNASDVPYLADDLYFDFSDLYFTFRGKIIDSLPQQSASHYPFASTFAVPNNRSDTTIGVDARLPKISLPSFSGEYMEWISFRDIYSSLVHNNESLTKIQKFYYLRGTLSGEAASLIRSISATEANYDSAWKILESRYHNKRIIVSNLVGRLYGLDKSDGGFQSIKRLLDSARECLSSLDNLGVDTGSWDPLLIHLLSQKLDLLTRKDWEQSLRSSTEIPSRREMFDFLERTFRTLESLNNDFHTSGNNSKIKKTSCHSGKLLKAKVNSCAHCGKPHLISKCFKFLALPLAMRYEFISQRKLCRNCLSTGHSHDNCPSPFRCISCKELHHSILHSDGVENLNQALTQSPSSSNDNSIVPNPVTSHTTSAFRAVLLYTIRLVVNANSGRFQLRALLDPGSQGSLISESAVQLIGLRKVRSHHRVIGIGEGNSTLSKFFVNVELFSRTNKPVMNCRALVLSNLSSYTPDPSSRHITMPNIEMDSLADPLFYNSDRIDMILGSDVISRIQIPTESFVHGNLFFQNTHFGWVFTGSDESVSINGIHIHNLGLETILRSFWEQEEVTMNRHLTEEETSCDAYFRATTKRSSSGRYMVYLPFKSLCHGNIFPVVDNNHFNALKRFRQLEISFSKRPQYSVGYKEFMKEYELLGHMSKVGVYPKDIRHNSYFLPHHGVFKEDSTTTKLRVVFDGSSHHNNKESLNDLLSPGPALQNDLPTVLTHWRGHKIAFCADIEKMFRQIDVYPEHRRFQQILWRYDPLDDISIYKLNTVTYGTTSAPYLAIRVLKKLAEDFESEFPEASRILVEDSYVDDILSGADSFENATRLQRDLCSLLRNGGCNLRKWITNSKDLLETIPVEHRHPSLTLDFDQSHIVKTLGIQWNTCDDCFFFKSQLTEPVLATKRSILSEAARLYDPLGWLTPTTVIAKSIFKSLWEHGIDWDSEIPDIIQSQWCSYRESLPKLANLKIPRWIGLCPGTKIEFHCFCDASSIAYAAVVYARVVAADGTHVNIIQAKSKISPIKTITIPRLELCAASLLVKLTRKVMGSFRSTDVSSIYYWSDSSTVLSWLRKSPSNWNVFVANRVADIQRFTNPLDWRYVPSTLNPADIASRGILPGDLVENKTWWNGPQFLYDPPAFWPENLSNLYTSDEERKKKIVAHTSETSTYPELLLKFSSLPKLLRVTSLCLRFAHNCIYKEKRKYGILSFSETWHSLLVLVKLSQKTDFPSEIKLLSSKRQIGHGPILKLMPFLDNEGILRVGGRLQNSNFSFDRKHPILLSKSNPLSTLIISDAHERTLHGGLSLTMSYVSRKFWIISGNQLCKTIIHKCIVCFRHSAKSAQQIMGNLPSVRLKPVRPFKHSGVDYAGPITIKASSVRSSATSKGYICLFVCMVTKAIHLEAVSDLTTNAFLAAFRRFISRRGACTDLYSDCGTNFIGASKELKVIYNKNEKAMPKDLLQALSQNETNWHFNPPASPNFGGLWEAGVKSAKFHLKRIMGDRVLNFEELTTLLCQIESCLNSRPLAPLSADPSDFDFLTPAHFLIGEPTNCIQEPSLLDTNINHLSRWKCVEKLKQHFWKRWHGDYLNRLQARPKWLKPRAEAKVGDLVLVSDEKSGPGQWNVGRIQEIFPGQDGHTRKFHTTGQH